MNRKYYQIPNFLYEKNIHNHLLWLTEIGVEKYNDLLEKQEETLARLIIDTLENDSFDILNLEDDDLPITSCSTEKILHNIYKYLRYDIDQLLSEIIEQNKYSSRRGGGLVSFTNDQTGETEWRISHEGLCQC